MEAATKVNQTIAALSLAQTLDNEAVERGTDISKINNLQNNVTSSIASGNRSEAENNLAELDEIASATYHTKSAIETEVELMDDKTSELETEYKKARDRVTELRNRENEEKRKGNTDGERIMT